MTDGGSAATNSSQTVECPYCKEDVKVDAIKCKHCGSRISPQKPSHGGTCPYCKEQIKPEAIVCRYCKSALGPKPQGGMNGGGCGGCSGCGGSPRGAESIQQSTGRGFRIQEQRRGQSRETPAARFATAAAPGDTSSGAPQAAAFGRPGPWSMDPYGLGYLFGDGTFGGVFGAWGCWDTRCCDEWGTCCLDGPYGRECWTCCIRDSPCEKCIWPW